MPPPAPRRLRLAVAIVGYALTAAACLCGMTVVALFWLGYVACSVLYLAWTGRFVEIRRRRWY
jgi:hypothetical protein